MTAQRRTSGLLVFALLACACVGATDSRPPATGTGASQVPARSGSSGQPVIPAADPAAAAAAVFHAPGDDERRVAILAILAATGIGVYGADGTPIVRGAERTESDFWVYDFEVEGLVGAVRDGDRVLLPDLAVALAAAGVEVNGRPVTTADVASAVTVGVARAAADPGARASAALSFARALAAAGPRDIDLSQQGAAIELDSLSNFLVAADILLPSIAAEAAPVAARSREIADADPRAMPHEWASGGCGQIANQNTVNSWGAGQAAVALLQGGIRKGMPASQMLHAILLNATVVARTSAADFHLAHDDDSTAPLPVLEATFFLRIDPSSQAVSCGLMKAALLGAEGPLVRLPVKWDNGPLFRYANVKSDGFTDAAGKALAIITPDPEDKPRGIGPEIHDHIQTTATADVAAGLGLDLFLRIGNASVKKTATFDIDVSYHRAYTVYLDIDATMALNNVLPNLRNPILGTTTVHGTLEASTAHALADSHWNPPLVGPLDLVTTPPSGFEGACDTFTANSKGHKAINWLVLDTVVYPAADIAVAIDAYGTNLVDETWTRLCDPQGNTVVLDRTGTAPNFSKGSELWESAMLNGRAHGPYGGIQFAGLGNGAWIYLATDQTWEHGGEVAIWDNAETCDGACKGKVKLVLRVSPPRGP